MLLRKSIILMACLGLSLLFTESRAAIQTVDITHFPNGTVVPDNATITNQYESEGIIFGGRQSNGNPQSLFIGGSGTTGRYLFNTPDVFGAIYHFTFVDTNTFSSADINYFSISPDFDGDTESLDLVGPSPNPHRFRCCFSTAE